MTNTPEKELLLAALRSAVLRAKLDANEIQTIAIALNAGMIELHDAIGWLSEIGIVSQLIPPESAPS